MTGNYKRRQEKLSNLLRKNKIDGIVLNPGPSLTYLSGLHFHLSERPVIMIFSPETKPTIILPELETGKLTNLNYEVQAFAYGEDPGLWPRKWEEALRNSGFNSGTVAVEPRQMRMLEFNLFHNAAPEINTVPAEKITSQLRSIKEPEEAEAMRTAVKIAQDAMEASLLTAKLGMTEKEFAAELTIQLLRKGSNPEFPFSPIVSSGPNSANPHASPSDRPFKNGDLLVVDWGASYNGYVSDLTRTFAIGKVDEELMKLAEIVLQANLAGRNACKPGTTAGEVDHFTRQVIVDAGYGDFFIHRTGHGLGMEGHEDPYIYNGNTMKLEPGMTFTIEPGIYLPGNGGVRIEDNIMVTEKGADCFSTIQRDLRILPIQ